MPLIQNPLAERIYNQNDVTVSVNGIRLEGLHEGSPIRVTQHGGEVEVTQGTDGPGLNVATRQGGRIAITLREGSTGHAVLQALRLQQDAAQVGSIIIISSGVGAIATLINALVSLPGELGTGDKKQGSREYHFIGTRLVEVPPSITGPVPALNL